MMLVSIFFIFLWVLYCVEAKDIFQLEESNFELTITAYRYLAVLFTDSSPSSKELELHWKEASSLLGDDFPENCEIGMVTNILLRLLAFFYPIYRYKATNHN
jgi:hypothetical protein